MNYEIIDSAELAKRLNLPVSWVRSFMRERTPRDKRIPCLKMGRYRRVEWGSPQLAAWLDKFRTGAK